MGGRVGGRVGRWVAERAGGWVSGWVGPRPAKPPPCKILKACSASGCAPRKTSHPLFSFIKGKVRAPNVPHTNRAQHAKHGFPGPLRSPATRRECPNVPECTRMYPNVPCLLVRMYPRGAYIEPGCTLLLVRMYPQGCQLAKSMWPTLSDSGKTQKLGVVKSLT